ncbi:MAG: hypothetical protein ACE5IR_09520 [bacterium]
MARTTRETILGMVSGSTWHTAVNLAANSGLYVTNIDKWALTGQHFEDKPAGQAEIQNIDLIQHEANPTFTFDAARRSGAEWKFWAGVLGSDAVTGAGPYVHTMSYNTNSSTFYTVGKEINNSDITEWPSLKVTGLTFENNNGVMKLTARTIGDTVRYASDATNTGTQFDAVTYVTNGLIIPFRECRFRINAQAGGALGSGDVINLSNLSLSIDRPYRRDDLTQGATDGTEKQTNEPIQNEPSNVNLSIEANDYATIALLQDMQNEVAYKADLFWSRTISTVAYQLTIELGSLYPMEQDISLDSPGDFPFTRTFRGIDPVSTPTGLATANPVHLILQDNFSTSYI